MLPGVADLALILANACAEEGHALSLKLPSGTEGTLLVVHQSPEETGPMS